MRSIIIALATLSLVGAAAAQPPPISPPPGNGPAANGVDCRAQAQAQGLRGQAMRDAVQLCVAELRVTCLKQAIAQKLVKDARKTFIKSCAGRPGAGQGQKG